MWPLRQELRVLHQRPEQKIKAWPFLLSRRLHYFFNQFGLPYDALSSRSDRLEVLVPLQDGEARVADLDCVEMVSLARHLVAWPRGEQGHLEVKNGGGLAREAGILLGKTMRSPRLRDYFEVNNVSPGTIKNKMVVICILGRLFKRPWWSG